MTASRGSKPPARIVTALAALLVGTRVPLTMILVGAQNSSNGGSNGGYNLSPSPIMTSSGDLGYSCNLAQEACAEEASCAECVSFVSGGSTARRRNRRLADEDDDLDGVGQEEEESCSSRYPLLLSGSMISFCERVGIAYCCQYSNNTVAEACLAIDMAAEVWDCHLQNLECTVRDMLCYAGYGETETPTFSPTPATHLSIAPTSSPTGNPTQASGKLTPTPMPTPVASGRGLDLTPWPAENTLFRTAGPSTTTTTTINSGRRTRAGSGVLSTCLFGLVASTVGWWHGLF